jgi:DNA-binding beta-propeller fold protein YncE
MVRRVPIRTALLAVAGLALVLTGCAAFGDSPAHEVWALDQGTDRIHIYEADHEQVAVIDVSPEALRDVEPDFDPEAGRTVPHMIDFDSRDRYAFVAATAGGATIVIDAAAREVAAVLLTGGGSHMAAVTPDDSAVWVAAIGAEQLVEIPLDLDADEPTFAVGERLDVADLLADTGYDWPSNSPVCHDYTPDASEAWITLGPGVHDGGLFVLDLETLDVAHAWDPAEVRANCGIGFTDDGERAVANWSGEFGDDAPDGEGEWYVFDTSTYDLLQSASSDGVDAHGLRIAPDGETFWQVNRGSHDGQIIDAESFEVIAAIPDAGDAPDILDFSPDGALVYVTQRGPTPLSGDPHVATGSQPGVAVIDAETLEVVEVLRPAEVTDEDGDVVNDVHGIGVRTTTGEERVVAATPLSTTVGGLAFSCHVQ